jgi:hypothetical protein
MRDILIYIMEGLLQLNSNLYIEELKSDIIQYIIKLEAQVSLYHSPDINKPS